jgi:hypothetical protein
MKDGERKVLNAGKQKTRSLEGGGFNQEGKSKGIL